MQPDISYTPYDNGERIGVSIAGQRVGAIRKVKCGYQYWPQNRKAYADFKDIRATVDEVKALLEAKATPSLNAAAENLAEAANALLTAITAELDLSKRSPRFVRAVKGLRAALGVD